MGLNDELGRLVPLQHYPCFVEVRRDQFYRLEAVVADPKLRRQALEFAAKRKAGGVTPC